MENIEQLSDFLKNCCRVCLSVENEMVESSNIVENFNKSIDELLYECANFKMINDNGHPKKLCEDCTTELVMVAKFREKCEMSSIALEQLKKQVNRMDKNEPFVRFKIDTVVEHTNTNTTESEHNSGEQLFESVEYAEENVEYIIYDEDYIDENDVHDKLQDESSQTNETLEIEDDDEESFNCDQLNENEETPKKKKNKQKIAAKLSKPHKTKKNAENMSKMKSIIKYHCKSCGAGFAQLNNFTRHLQTHSDTDINIGAKDIAESSSYEAENDVTKIPEEPHNQDINSKTVANTDNIQTNIKKMVQKTHTCRYCSRNFPSLSLLATHIRIHTGERPFDCNICSKSFKTQGALDLHVRRHNGIKPFVCKICNRGFVESSNLKVHIRTHTGEKPHVCVMCGRSFSRVFLLQIHQRTHTGEKPYSCDSCNKSFAQQGDLAAHRRIHSGERPHRCSVCNKGFIKSSGLTQHMRRHERSTSSSTKAATNTDLTSVVENGQVELMNEEQHISAEPKNVMVCYKEYKLDEYLKTDNAYI